MTASRKLTPEEVRRMYPVTGLTEYRNGVCKVKRESVITSPPGGGGKKQSIEYLSAKSRSYLAFVVAATAVEFTSILTLTYPEIYPTTGKAVKADLNVVLGHLRRTTVGFSYVWVLEFQKRGAPHIHILSNIDGPPEWLRRDVAYLWSKTATRSYYYTEGSDGTYAGELAARHKVYLVHKHHKQWEPIRSADGAVRYVVKYCLKTRQKVVPENFRDVGRFFGWSRNVKDSIVPHGHIEIDDEGLRLLLGTMDHSTAEWDVPPKYIFGLSLVLEECD